LGRAIRLAARVRGKGIDVGVSHGSRSHILASSLAGIGCITAYDYEHSSKLFVHSLPDQILLPACLRTSDRFRTRTPEKVKFYDGFKEEIYLSAYKPSPDFELNSVVDAEAIVVLVRPPAEHVHYHTSDSVGLFLAVMDAALAPSDTQVVLIPRSSAQELQLREKYRPLGEKVVIPERAVDGLDAIWHSDLVVSAGGTMNREAALLGVPTYSILTAALGEADRSLIREGKLTHVPTPDHVPFIRFEKRAPVQTPMISASVLDFFVERITSFGQDST
jgi:predicted glycosyltransferase